MQIDWCEVMPCKQDRRFGGGQGNTIRREMLPGVHHLAQSAFLAVEAQFWSCYAVIESERLFHVETSRSRSDSKALRTSPRSDNARSARLVFQRFQPGNSGRPEQRALWQP